MTTRLPIGKSARTRTAAIVGALTKDTEQAAAALRRATELYEQGRCAFAAELVDGAMNLLAMAHSSWRWKK